MINKMNGYTLIELMVSFSISLIVLSCAVALFSVNSSFGTQHFQKDFLRGQLNFLATTMSDEISRAGFCYNCSSANPYMLKDVSNGTLNDFSSILLDDNPLKKSGNCILFAYNHDKRSDPGTIHKDDAKGYRLGTDPKGWPVIEIYENRKGLSNWDCKGAYWQDMTHNPLSIEELIFERENFLANNGVNVLQNIKLTITGFLTNNNSMKETVTVTINVPNVDG